MARMAMGRRKDRARTPGLWIATNELPVTGGHPFYQRLNQILDTHAFDAFVEAQCAPFYAATVGRPSLTPGTYFRLLLIGYFEGIDSERGIAWRTADSLALRGFLGLGLEETPPEHSTISRTRRLIDLETHRAVFTWILQVLATADLVKGTTIGIDATTLEANAALRSIVRHDSGETYQEFLTRLAQASEHRHPDAGRLGAARSEALEERAQHGLAASARPRCAHHEDEGWAHASRAQGRARGRPGDRRDRRRDGAGGRSGRHDDDRRDGHDSRRRVGSRGHRDGRRHRGHRRGRRRQGVSQQSNARRSGAARRTDLHRRTEPGPASMEAQGRGPRRGPRQPAADPRPTGVRLAAVP